jgi:hypothetical protein
MRGSMGGGSATVDTCMGEGGSEGAASGASVARARAQARDEAGLCWRCSRSVLKWREQEKRRG